MSKKEKKLLILTSFIYMINAVMVTMTTYSIAKVMECAEAGDMEKLPMTIIVAIGVLFAEKISAIAMTASNLWYISTGDLTLKRKIMKNILERSMNVFRKKDDGYYINMMTNDIAMFRENYLGNIPWICYSVVYSVFSIIMLATLNPLLAVITTFLAAIPFLVEKVLSGYVEKHNNEYSRKQEKYISILTETVEGYEAIRMDNSSSSFLKRYDQASTEGRIAAANMTFANSISQEALYTSASVLRIVVLGIGALLVVKGYMKASMLYAAMNYAIAVSNNFSNISSYVISIHSTQGITNKLKEECNYQCVGSTMQKEGGAPTLEYKDVCFRFDEKNLYNNFTYRFEPGRCYVIVGESGSGKSTLLKLFLKYYDTYSGVIKFNGIDIKNLNEQDLYEQIRVINQSPWIFNASLYENITMCTNYPEESSEEYKNLLRTLNLVELSERVGNNPLGDFGDRISGGERQRINLARALRSNAKMLIFDEPTTGLDPENVQMINEVIFNLSDVTRIVISHDWSEEYLNRFDGVIKIGKEVEVEDVYEEENHRLFWK